MAELGKNNRSSDNSFIFAKLSHAPVQVDRVGKKSLDYLHLVLKMKRTLEIKIFSKMRMT